jgi:sugar phosphate isomerase/epimerase
MTIDRRKFIHNSSLILSAGVLGTGIAGCSDRQSQPQISAPTESAVARKEIDLLASYWTIAGDVDPGGDGREYSSFDFRDRVEAISRIGFKGMGIWHTDLYKTLETRTLAEMKQILDDNGIVHIEIEFLFDWFLDGERKKQSDLEKAKLLGAAEALGARHVKVGDFFNQPYEMDKLIVSFSALCKDAADVGTRILFEVMPFSMIDNLEDSLTMLEGADADNGGLMIDTWHIVKMGTPYEEVANIPRRFLLGIELNDGYLQTPEGMDLNVETTQHRKFPGEGEFDMPGFMAAIEASGYDGPYGVEVIARSNRALPLDEVVQRAYDTTMAQFA